MKNEEKPQLSIKGLTFFPIPEFDSASCAFGAEEKQFFNRRDIPYSPSKFERYAQTLMFNGGTLPEEISPIIDKQKAIRAVKAWLSSFAPAHEAKIGTVAYAFWVWSDHSLIESASKAP